MITKLLSAAVKFYLRSQVSQVEDLQVKISGTNRQILQGYIPQVFLSCQRATYQGLRLKEIELNGDSIAVNLPEILKQKPLKLIEPIVVRVKLALDSEDLSASLNSDLLQNGLSDLWQIVLARQGRTPIDSQLANPNIEWNSIAIANKQLSFSGTYQDDTETNKELKISTGVSLADSHTLCLSPLAVSNQLNDIGNLSDKLEIDLGTDVFIEQLTIESEQILCLGKITVNS